MSEPGRWWGLHSNNCNCVDCGAASTQQRNLSEHNRAPPYVVPRQPLTKGSSAYSVNVRPAIESVLREQRRSCCSRPSRVDSGAGQGWLGRLTGIRGHGIHIGLTGQALAVLAGLDFLSLSLNVPAMGCGGSKTAPATETTGGACTLVGTGRGGAAGCARALALHPQMSSGAAPLGVLWRCNHRRPLMLHP